MIDRKEYMKTTYANYWSNARNDLYGFMDYDRALINLISSQIPSQSNRKNTLLEVAIGTGEPIAKNLVTLGYDLTGIDISSLLIDQCKQNNPSIRCQVGDAEQLTFQDSTFDLTYCVHSSWFIPNFGHAITEMIRVTNFGGGVVIFDIQNIYNQEIDENYRRYIFENTIMIGRVIKIIKNSAKFLLKKGTQDWPFFVSQTPSDPIAIYEILFGMNLAEINLFAWVDNEMLPLGDKVDHYKVYPRLVFLLKK